MLKVVHIEYSVHTNEFWNGELNGIVPYNLGDGVWPISKRVKLVVGYREALLLQM